MATPGILIKQPWSLQVDEVTSIAVPQLTTAERDNLVAPPNGTIIYNTTFAMFQSRSAGAWVGLTTQVIVLPSSTSPVPVDAAYAYNLITLGAGAFTLSNPINISDGAILHLTLYNNTANPSGTITWSNLYEQRASMATSVAANTAQSYTLAYRIQWITVGSYVGGI